MPNAIYKVPVPVNEPVKGYEHGSAEKKEMKATLKKQAAEKIEIPMVIGGQEVRTGNLADCVMPHNHKHVLGQYHKGGEKEVKLAIKAAKKAKKGWADRKSVV